jgi:hypothetical protein
LSGIGSYPCRERQGKGAVNASGTNREGEHP